MTKFEIPRELKKIIENQGVGPMKLDESATKTENNEYILNDKFLELNVNNFIKLQERNLAESKGNKILLIGDSGKIEANIGDYVSNKGSIVSSEAFSEYKPMHSETLKEAVNFLNKEIINRPIHPSVEAATVKTKDEQRQKQRRGIK